MSILGNTKPSQIAIIVNDIEESKKKYAKFFGVEVPPTITGGSFEITQTEYKGKPAPEAGCKMAFFNLESIMFEIIEPNAAQSTWRDFLEERGEGLHHIAFTVDDLQEGIKSCKEFGLELTQQGNYGDGSGGYAYFDATKDLKCFIELLCSYNK
jgi:4-hydroxyphenylpyruvate dioxygenase-like putative hemolysin